MSELYNQARPIFRLPSLGDGAKVLIATYAAGVASGFASGMEDNHGHHAVAGRLLWDGGIIAETIIGQLAFGGTQEGRAVMRGPAHIPTPFLASVAGEFTGIALSEFAYHGSRAEKLAGLATSIVCAAVPAAFGVRDYRRAVKGLNHSN